MLAREVIEEIRAAVEGGGYDLAHVEWKGGRGQGLLRVFIEREDGIGVSDCERVSRELSALLDALDPFEGRYSLEVSSTGVERPIFHPEEYAQFVGRGIYLKLSAPVDGVAVLKARLLGDDGSSIRVGVGSQEYRIDKNSIRASHLLGPWEEVD